jgi:WD40 repeat protein
MNNKAIFRKNWYSLLFLCVSCGTILLASFDGTIYGTEKNISVTPTVNAQEVKFLDISNTNLDFKFLNTVFATQAIMQNAIWRPTIDQIAITYYKDTKIDIIDIAGNLIYTLKTPSKVAPSLGVTHMTWSPDGRFLATAFEDEAVNIWDFSKDPLEQPIQITYPGRIPFLTFSADSRRLLVAWGFSLQRELTIWEVNTGRLIQKLAIDLENEPADEKVLNWVLWSPNGKYFATSTFRRDLRLWNAGLLTIIKRAGEGNCGWGCGDRNATWSPDSKAIAMVRCFQSRGGGCEPQVWDIASNQINAPSFPVDYRLFGSKLEWSSDSSYIAGSDVYNKIVYLWDAKTLEPAAKFIGFKVPPQWIGWNTDESKFMMATSKEISLWDVSRIK